MTSEFYNWLFKIPEEDLVITKGGRLNFNNWSCYNTNCPNCSNCLHFRFIPYITIEDYRSPHQDEDNCFVSDKELPEYLLSRKVDDWSKEDYEKYLKIIQKTYESYGR